jgi:mono/diheme cytochrome c family protein
MEPVPGGRGPIFMILRPLAARLLSIPGMRRLVIVAGALALCGALQAADESGAALYKRQCAGCHGADGKGQSSMGKAMKLRDLGSADVQKMSDADLAGVIAKGKGKMPAYGGKLSQDQIQALVAYIRGMKR